MVVASCAPKIISTAYQGEKSDFGITAPGKAVFFVENENKKSTEEQIKLHKETADKLYNKMGLATDQLMIGRTNAKTFKFSTANKTWFVDVKNLKKRTAMILFDGHAKPMIEYNPNRYSKLVHKYLADDLKKAEETRKEKVVTKRKTALVLDSLWKIPFSPDRNYADKVINVSQTTYYPALFQGKCQGEIQSTAYSDVALKEMVYRSSTTYDKGRIMASQYSRNEDEFQQKYYFNRLGLIDSSISTLNKKPQNKVYFKYLPDRYITRSSTDDRRDEYLLNEKKQVFKKVPYNDDNAISAEQLYFYDHLGRLVREENYAAGKKNLSSVYEYNNAEKIFSTMKTFDSNDQLISENTNGKIKGLRQGQTDKTFTTKVKGKILSKSISDVDDTCEGKITVLNADNEVTQVVVQVRTVR